MGGGTGEKSRKNWKCLLWRGRGGDSEPPEWDLAGVRLHPMGKASMPGSSPPCPRAVRLKTAEDLLGREGTIVGMVEG